MNLWGIVKRKISIIRPNNTDELKVSIKATWASITPRMSFICHIHNYTEYNEEWNVFSAFNPSKCTHLEQWAADCAAPGEQSWTSCRSRDSNPQPWVTWGFKSNYPLGQRLPKSCHRLIAFMPCNIEAVQKEPPSSIECIIKPTFNILKTYVLKIFFVLLFEKILQFVRYWFFSCPKL